MAKTANMNTLLKVLNRFKYEPRQWTYAKILTALLWLTCIILNIKDFHREPCDIGLCHFINCGFFTIQPVSFIVIAVSVLLSGLYIFERMMVVCTFLMALIGYIVFSVAEANGEMRMAIVTIALLAQCIAYIQYRNSGITFKSSTTAYNLAMFYSIQVIAACYVLAAISKLEGSGLEWISQAPNLALRVIKSATSRALDYNSPGVLHFGKIFAKAILQHPLIVQLAFGLTLVIEFFAFLAPISRSFCRKYSYLILLMHAFMLLIMNIVLPAFVVMVVAYLLNLPSKKMTTTVSSEVAGPQPFTTQLKEIPYAFFLGGIYIVLSLYIGEQHPFSRFPMFSNMDNQCTYFSLSDQNNNPLSPVKYLGVRTGQITKILAIRAKNTHVSMAENSSRGEITQSWLENSVQAHKGIFEQHNIQEVKLITHRLWLEKGEILTRDTLTARVIIKPLSQ